MKQLYARRPGLFLLSVLLGAGVHSARAQRFEPGYAISPTGDTVRVELENRFWKAAPDRVRYRTDAATPILDVPTRRLRGFGFASGRQWRVLPLQYDAAAEERQANVVPGSTLSKMHTDTVVTEILALGPVTLLSAFEDTTPHYFVLKSDSPPLELVNRVVARTAPDGSQTLLTINNYRDQLRLYLQPECPAVASGWNSLAFTPAALARLIATYNQACLGAVVAPPTAPPRQRAVRLDAGLLLAGSSGTGSFANGKTTGGPGFLSSDFQQQNLERPYLSGVERRLLLPAAGLYLDALMQGRILAIHGEVQLAPSTSSSHRISTGFADFPAKEYHFRQRTQLSGLAGLRVFGAVGKGSLLAGGGYIRTRTGFEDAVVTYPEGNRRSLRGGALPDRREFAMPASLSGFYLEGGYRRGRLLGSLAWRWQSGTAAVTDVTTISSLVFNKTNNQVVSTATYNYAYQLRQLQLTVSYRLSPDTDK